MPRDDADIMFIAGSGVDGGIGLSDLRHHRGEPLVPPEAEATYRDALELWQARVDAGLAFDAPALMLARDGGRWSGVVTGYVQKRAACDAVRAMEPQARAARYGRDGGPWPLTAGVHLTIVTSDGLVPATLRPASMFIGGGTAALSCTEGLDPSDLAGTILDAAGAARRALLEEFGVTPKERPGTPVTRVLGAYLHRGLAEIALVAVADLRRSAVPIPFARVAASRLRSRWEPEALDALPLRDALAGRAEALGMPLGAHSRIVLDLLRGYEASAGAPEMA